MGRYLFFRAVKMDAKKPRNRCGFGVFRCDIFWSHNVVAETGLELTSRFFWYVLHRPLFPVFNRSMVLCGFFNFQSGTAKGKNKGENLGAVRPPHYPVLLGGTSHGTFLDDPHRGREVLRCMTGRFERADRTSCSVYIRCVTDAGPQTQFDAMRSHSAAATSIKHSAPWPGPPASRSRAPQ